MGYYVGALSIIIIHTNIIPLGTSSFKDLMYVSMVVNLDLQITLSEWREELYSMYKCTSVPQGCQQRQIKLLPN